MYKIIKGKGYSKVTLISTFSEMRIPLGYPVIPMLQLLRTDESINLPHFTEPWDLEVSFDTAKQLVSLPSSEQGAILFDNPSASHSQTTEQPIDAYDVLFGRATYE